VSHVRTHTINLFGGLYFPVGRDRDVDTRLQQGKGGRSAEGARSVDSAKGHVNGAEGGDGGHTRQGRRLRRQDGQGGQQVRHVRPAHERPTQARIRDRGLQDALLQRKLSRSLQEGSVQGASGAQDSR